ncbi:MAG: SH3 domain-containing protein [Clostridia bacterium]|nr:SH3 domain-containing protein [Clostridia bacterium]
MKKSGKYSVNRIVVMIMLLSIVCYALLNVVNSSKVFALTQTREGYSNRINSYAGYKVLIDELKASHPNWNFTFLYTGLDWNQVIKNETTATHGRNVVPASRSDAWKCDSCGETPRGGSSWRCASESAVAYYMDPRNWMTEDYIFEFENLSFNGDIQTVDGVKKIISGIKYMNVDNNVTYTNTDGNKVTMDKTYAQIIMEAAEEVGISPYHLASRIRQEQGAGSTPGSTATGTYGGYVGYYNFLNIKASGSTDSQVIANGLAYARDEGWTDPEISIKEGAQMLAQKYINDGQDTLYLQKFDVDNSDGALYWHQYMQNASAAVTEGAQVRKTYEELGLINSSIEFVIPVFENMPDNASPEPIDGSIVTQNVISIGDNVVVRNAPNGYQNNTAFMNEKMLRIEMAANMVNGHYWDKVVLCDNSIGYIARDYIKEIETQTNCNKMMVANTSVNLRNGPGVYGTTVITMLTKGQVVTRIEKGQYDMDGYIWDRITLADGRGGYIAQKYLSKQGEVAVDDTGDTITTEIIKVVCNSGLKVREQPGTDQKVLTYVDKNDTLTRTASNVSGANGYTWDKVVTASGIEGYIARGDSKESYVQVVSNNSTNTNTNTNSNNEPNNNIKIEETNLICEPATTIESIKEKYTEVNITVTNVKGEVVTSGNVGTGYKITISDKSYTVVKLGDANGDGKINSLDALSALKNSAGIENISGVYLKALDVNGDGKVNSLDALDILKASVGNQKISI